MYIYISFIYIYRCIYKYISVDPHIPYAVIISFNQLRFVIFYQILQFLIT